MKKLFLFVLAALATTAFAQESHTVQANQTLYSIARLYNVSVDQLKEWNNLGTAAIRVGQSLVVKPAAQLAANPGLNPFLYTVRTGDSLSALAIKFDTPPEVLKKINSLDDASLYVGQRLFIRRPVGITFYNVQSGDTVGHVAALFNIAPADLVAINQLGTGALAPGRVLRVFKPAEVPLNHTVAAIDTPQGISALYGISVAELQRINGDDALNLKVGQVLKLRSYASASQGVFASPALEQAIQKKVTTAISFPDAPATAPAVPSAPTYVVQKGDTMLKITRANNLTIQDLLAWNKLTADSVLRVGQTLVLGPPQAGATATPTATVPVTPVALTAPAPKANISFPDAPSSAPADSLPDFLDSDQAKIKWDSYVVLDKAIPVFEWNNDYYYWTHPGEVSQPNRGYYENSWPSPLDAYKKASQLMAKFEQLIDQKGPLSTILKGYTIVLDPGHGGLDPGAIVKAADQNGKDVYLTEHEYVYDIALRVYALLKRHGANVVLTVMAPNHLIRDTQPANNTLINEKNQVYADMAMNRSDDNDAWPNGSQSGLDKRVSIADKAFRGTAPDRRVFVSLHADNNPFSPLGTGVYALETREGSVDDRSLAFARKMVPFLGTDAYARTQNLAVLRGNDADYKVLVEVHNLASDQQSEAMRAGSSRQLSAQKIVRGILEAFRK
jgi:LysM repeat protein/N-acetylmuramoyl-L-alanine amidase